MPVNQLFAPQTRDSTPPRVETVGLGSSDAGSRLTPCIVVELVQRASCPADGVPVLLTLPPPPPPPAGTAHTPSPRQNVVLDAPLPLFNALTGKLPMLARAAPAARSADVTAPGAIVRPGQVPTKSPATAPRLVAAAPVASCPADTVPVKSGNDGCEQIGCPDPLIALIQLLVGH